MGRWWRSVLGQDAQEQARQSIAELEAANLVLAEDLNCFRARVRQLGDWVGCVHCGRECGHAPKCKYRHMRPMPDALSAELARVEREVRDKFRKNLTDMLEEGDGND
jgi:hypothetical protein